MRFYLGVAQPVLDISRSSLSDLRYPEQCLGKAKEVFLNPIFQGGVSPYSEVGAVPVEILKPQATSLWLIS